MPILFLCMTCLTDKQFFIGTWTTLDYDIFGPASIEAIRKQYISKIGQQIGPASLEAAHAFHQQFSRCPGMQFSLDEP